MTSGVVRWELGGPWPGTVAPLRSVLVVGAALFAGLIAFGVSVEPRMPAWLGAVDLATGAAASTALLARRRHPVAVGVVTAIAASWSDAAFPAAFIALFSVAVHRSWRVVLPVGGVVVAAAVGYLWIRGIDGLSVAGYLSAAVTAVAVVVAWGMFVGARRQLTVSLRERAELLESEQSWRLAQAREAERTRIAREMHDVLAHRISLVSMHAGALEFRPDASPERVAEAAAVIRQSAHLALEELREVLGVLRSGPGEESARPMPVLADLSALVDQSRVAGTQVRLDLGGIVPHTVPDGLGRTVYRVVQEGLTNARKHAPGVPVDIRVAGAAGAGIAVEVTNPAPRQAVSSIPGAGAGLAGLAERAALAGGQLVHGWGEDGRFRLEARLPWPA